MTFTPSLRRTSRATVAYSWLETRDGIYRSVQIETRASRQSPRSFHSFTRTRPCQRERLGPSGRGHGAV